MQMGEMANEITIDFDGVLEVALKGIRRSSVFLGLGVNAATDRENRAYQLSSLTQIQIVPEYVSPETVQHFKDEFKVWIEAAALREATESFALFVDELHRKCSIIYAVRNAIGMNELVDKQNRFAREGVPNKLNLLDQTYGVKAAGKDYLLLLNKARNCLAHRGGRVGPEDINEEAAFSVAWRGLDIFVEEPNGKRAYLLDIPEDGLWLENGGIVKAQFVERRRSFGLGAVLELSPRDLAEICWFYADEARAIVVSAVEYAKANGVIVRDSKKL
jgi:hypothetical protein